MREKQTRNHSGSIFKRTIKRDGKTIVVFDARKRYKNRKGESKEKFRRCASSAEASAALVEFQNEINAELKVLTDESLIEFFVGVREKTINFTEFKAVIKTIQK